MKGVSISQYGEADVLDYRDNLPMPTVGESDVLVKVHAAGLNPVDWKIRKGYLEGMLNHQLPLILGWDVAGEIVALGDQVVGWQLGDAIYSRPNIERNGAYAEYISIDASEVAAKPKQVTWQEAAAVPLAALTAWQALYEAAQLKPGDKVLIHAGAGGVGHFAIQLAKIKGAEVFTTTSERNQDFVHKLGADHIINYKKEDFSSLRDLDVVFDTMGGEVQQKSWQTLRKNGVLVSITDTPDEAVANEHHVRGEFVFVQPNPEQLAEIAGYIDEGKIKITIDSTYSLADVKAAHELSESGRTRGKIILTP